MTSYSREYLRELPEQHRQQMITNVVKQYHSNIIGSATSGKLNCMIDLTQYLKSISRKDIHYSEYIPTIEDIVEKLKKIYEGCRVEYIDDWIETKPGIKEQKQGILVDWS